MSADWRSVFTLAETLGKAVEIFADPDRQDLNLDLVKMAANCGAYLALGTDAHYPWQLQFIDFGLASALASKFPRERILNFMSAGELKTWAASVRRGSR